MAPRSSPPSSAAFVFVDMSTLVPRNRHNAAARVRPANLRQLHVLCDQAGRILAASEAEVDGVIPIPVASEPNQTVSQLEVPSDHAYGELHEDAFMAEALAMELDYVERVDRLTTIAEGRRNASLREIDRHRPVFAETLRRSVQQIEHDEINVIEAPPSKGEPAA